MAIVSKAVVPDAALIDPQTLTTLSPHQVACTGMDALTHAIEAYVSTANSPITDLHALEAIRLITAHLTGAVANHESLDHQGPIVLASLEAGLAFSITRYSAQCTRWRTVWVVVLTCRTANATLSCCQASLHSTILLPGSV